ncbi:MAG: metal ABC transporter solute-binding protein, Zn/Mn family [Planctomycetota bacterium]
MRHTTRLSSLRAHALASACLLVALLGASAGAASTKRTTAIATTAMVADIVRNVGGEHVEVQALIGAGVDPHLYRPTRGDVASMMRADVIFYNGLNLEGKMSDTFVRIARGGKPVYAVTERIEAAYRITNKATEHSDPHVWMDPKGWVEATKVVTAALCELDTAHAEAFRSAGAAYIEKLEQLDAYARASFATIPESARTLVTAHDAFNYMARAYGIQVHGIQGISTESQAGLKHIEELVDMLAERGIPAVFTESSVSPRNITALVEGTKARGHDVSIGGELFSDAMGRPGTYEGTYIGMIDHNVTTIVNALGGTAPARGLNGQLGTAGSH